MCRLIRLYADAVVCESAVAPLEDPITLTTWAPTRAASATARAIHTPTPRSMSPPPTENTHTTSRSSRRREASQLAQRLLVSVVVNESQKFGGSVTRCERVDARSTEELAKIIANMLASSPEPIAEEWAIHDYQDFGDVRLGEYEDLNIVSALATGIVDHGSAFGAWANLAGHDPETLARFEEAFLGTWDKVEDYAEELLDGIGATSELAALPEWLHPYIKLDIESFVRDLELGGDISIAEDDGKVHIFDGRA